MTRLVIATLSAVKKLNKNNKSILSISLSTYGAPEVHLTLVGFIENFKSYTISKRDSDQYPTELHNTVEGVKFFALSIASYVEVDANGEACHD